MPFVDALVAGSSTIHSIGYDADTLTLRVFFRTNPAKAYEYEAVPESIWDNFRSSQSKGQYFALFIKPMFKLAGTTLL